MERRYIILTILFAVSLVLVAMGISDLSRAGSQVVVEEINSFGDKSAAEGLKLSIPVGGFEDRLQWETRVVFGESTEVTSKVSFTPWAQDDRWRLAEPEPVGINIHVTGNDGHNRLVFEREENDGDFFEEWSELKAVYDAIPLDEIENDPNYYVRGVKKILCLNDYYDYYPLFVEGTVAQTDGIKGVRTIYSLDFSDTRYTGYKEYEQSTNFIDYGYWVEAEKSENPIKNLCRGIKYRLWPEYPQNAYVKVSKEVETQEIWQYVCEMVKDGAWESYNDTAVDKPVEAYSVSEATETDIYYAVDLRLKQNERPRAETFEEGYGVWRIGYEVVKKKADIKLQFTEVEPEMIYAIDPEERLLEMILSKLRKELYVFTAKDGTCFMTVIDLQSEHETQRIELMTYDPEAAPSIRNVFQGENVIVPVLTAEIWGEEDSEEKMAVVMADETGGYELQFVIDKATDTADPAYQYQRQTYWREATLWERDPVSVEVAYQDGKLAMVYSLTNSYGNDAGGWESQRPCGFWVAVYDEDGVAYAADYRISLGINEYELGVERDNICEIRDDVEIGISWGE